ncbi:hypothetical protein ACLOJK_035079 [Asimina triloba]
MGKMELPDLAVAIEVPAGIHDWLPVEVGSSDLGKTNTTVMSWCGHDGSVIMASLSLYFMASINRSKPHWWWVFLQLVGEDGVGFVVVATVLNEEDARIEIITSSLFF